MRGATMEPGTALSAKERAAIINRLAVELMGWAPMIFRSEALGLSADGVMSAAYPAFIPASEHTRDGVTVFYGNDQYGGGAGGSWNPVDQEGDAWAAMRQAEYLGYALKNLREEGGLHRAEVWKDGAARGHVYSAPTRALALCGVLLRVARQVHRERRNR